MQPESQLPSFATPRECCGTSRRRAASRFQGKTVTGFTDGEEEEMGLTKVVPFLVEDELLRLGATYSKVKNWGVYTVKDGLLITGQNPASSGPAAKVLIDTLNAARARRRDPAEALS